MYFLNSELQQNMSKKLNGVPALVIKYDEDFDLNDRDAKEMYAAQVKEYFQWVQALRWAHMPPIRHSSEESRGHREDLLSACI